MHITNKIFLGLTLLLAPAYFYFVVVALGNQNKYQQEFLKCESEIQQQQGNQWKLLHGADGIYQTRSKLSRLTAGRGRIWVTTQHSPYSPNGVNMEVSPLLILASEAVGTIGGATEGSETISATTGSVSGLMPVRVELFEQVDSSANVSVSGVTEPAGAEATTDSTTVATSVQQQAKIGKYLGQFNVQANGGSWTLIPTRELSPSLLAQIQNSKTAWLAYEKMPKQRPNVIEKDVTGGCAVKMRTTSENEPQLLQWTDYAGRLHTLNDNMVELAYQMSRIQLNVSQLQSATLVASDNTQRLTTENTQLLADLQQTNKVYETVKLCVKTLRGRIEEVNQEIATTHDQNVQWASDLASIQHKVMAQLNAVSHSYASVP